MIEEILEDFENRFKLAHIERIPKREAELSPFPENINSKLVNVLKESGIKSLYSHQAQAIKEISNGKNTIVVTPTASGKTLCYNIPVLNSIIKDPDARALYLFPTKALSQDQVKALERLIVPLGIDIKTYTYDGDTPTSVRKRLRTYGNIIITNPDMLHTGILPHHTRWLGFFTKLKYIVIDEIHTYRGLFGSHMANVLKRLDRICKFYNSNPIYICSSATIANPKELAEKLTDKEFILIDDNGAPSGEKWFIFWNPPRVAKTIERRRSPLIEAKEIGKKLIEEGVQTIFFTRSRVSAEVLGTYLKQSVDPKLAESIKSYRAGYLPIERREIEKKLFSGEVMGVVSTTALELGIDIGELDSSILVGYPGSISSTWQQAGRAGRGEDFALSILIA
ncbi:MAG: DEAD/DEAH box helicase, partial [Actinobacteria bacterium]|nr:DEAD/DEAH box helicase [Actinomycetota bacterium]